MIYLPHIFRLLYSLIFSIHTNYKIHNNYQQNAKDILFLIGNLNTIIPDAEYQQKIKNYIRKDRNIYSLINKISSMRENNVQEKDKIKNEIIIWLYKFEDYIINNNTGVGDDGVNIKRDSEIIEEIYKKYDDYEISPQIINYLNSELQDYINKQHISIIYKKEWLEIAKKFINL